jgi:hypothetical protein
VNPAAEKLLQNALRICKDPAVSALIEGALEVETSPDPRSRHARNQKAYRDRKRDRDRSLNGHDPGHDPITKVTDALSIVSGSVIDPLSNVSARVIAFGGRGGPLGSASIERSPVDLKEGARAREVTDALSSVIGPVTEVRRIENATDDACFGLAVTAWTEQISIGIGKPFPTPKRSELLKLVETIVSYCPDVNSRVEWARQKAQAFIQAKRDGYKGRVSVHVFADFCAEPCPPTSSVQCIDDRQRARDRAHRELKKAAVRAPTNLLDFVKVGR